jgi:hypothetical protein
MIKELEEIVNISERLRFHIEDEKLFKSDRDQFIEKLQLILNERQKLIEAFELLKLKRQPDPLILTEEDKAITEKILALDQEIIQLLKLRMKEHQSEWHQVRKKGKTVSKYIRPFQAATTRNGAFYDKRK